jgi:hypothetical protein
MQYAAHTPATIINSNRKIVEKGKTFNTNIHDCSFSWLGTGSLTKQMKEVN